MTRVVIISSKRDKKSFLEEFLSFWLRKENFRIEIYEKDDDLNLKDNDILIILQDDNIDKFVNNINSKYYTIFINFYYNSKNYNLHNFCNIDIRIKKWILEREKIPNFFNYTCIENFKKELVNIIKNRRKKYVNLINPGKVSAYDVNQYYGNIYKISNEEEIFTPNDKLRDISNDFNILKYDKKVNIYIPVYYRLNKAIKRVLGG